MTLRELKVGITLSGGGVRASCFHLGVLKRLAEENLLEQINVISTVSGGSLLIGLLYQSNEQKWPSSKEFDTCSKFVKTLLTTRNLQRNIIARTPLWPFLYLGKGRASIVGAGLRSCWGITSRLNQIAVFPKWIINGTAIESGKSWRFIPQSRMGDYVLNYVANPDLALSDVLGASAGVPLLLGPLTINTSKFKWFKYNEDRITTIEHKPEFKRLHIWDGGAYDNLGIEPLVKYNDSGPGLKYREEINFLIVSDAALQIGTSKRKWYNAMRLIDITMDQVRALRARSLWDHFEKATDSGVYFKIGETIEKIKRNYKATANVSSKNLTDEEVASCKFFPTTLRKLSEKEFDTLVKHGWEVANASLICRCPGIFQNQH